MARHFKNTQHPTPQVQLLGNDRYAVMLSASGSGYSCWRDLAVTRWREDFTCDDWGSWIFLRDVDTGEYWSASAQPCGAENLECAVTLTANHARFECRNGSITSVLEVAVANEFDAEIRRLSVSNHGSEARKIEVVSYAEIVLGSAATDADHPAYSKLFVQTEALDSGAWLLATRRPQPSASSQTWAAHCCTSDDGNPPCGFQTDRARFLGRGRSIRDAIALIAETPEPGVAGTVLDPIFSLRHCVTLAPGASVKFDFWTVIASDREAVIAQARRCAQMTVGDAVLDAARQADDSEEIARFQHLAAPVLYNQRVWRAPAETCARGHGGAPALWAHGISGDRPIVLLSIGTEAQLELLHELLRAQRYWRTRQLAVDLVVMNTAMASDVDALQAAVAAVIDPHQAQLCSGDGIKVETFALRGDQLDADAEDALSTVARVVLNGVDGELTEQIACRSCDDSAVVQRSRATDIDLPTKPTPIETLQFFNGLGGFSANGREYVTILDGGRCTPMPWINVIANRDFGFLVSAEGGGYTWSLNSQKNALTPWRNDPVGDRASEIIYLRDLDDGALWSATALPIRTGARHSVRHGPGYSRFEHSCHGIEVDLIQFVAAEDPVKISRLTLKNTSGRARRLTVTAYVEWALGAIGSNSKAFVVSRRDPMTGALFARNAWREEFAERVAFVDLGDRQESWTCDRGEFLGRNGALDRPAALRDDKPLSGATGAGLDPCAALQAVVALAPNESIELMILLGDAADIEHARTLINRYRDADLDAARGLVETRWNEVGSALKVHTPERSLDLLVNHWLPYQVLSCRVWARTALYQCSGAYGFRDQLQDVMALCLSQPAEVRAHLLRSAGRQFVEGDVQHWWLPPANKGVRTRIADDRLWLPYAVAHYTHVTGDTAVLDEDIAFLEGPALKPDQVDNYFAPQESSERGSLFEHCARALDSSLATGAHGLPLFGSGDWNDGMNHVGKDGRGESVWLAWFLHIALTALLPHAEARGETTRAATWRAHADALIKALEREAWDGQWWRRGWYDDGTVLGSSVSRECRIDSIAQSWSVMAAVADPQRAAQAMSALDTHLVRRDARLIELFTPAFDQTPLDPGYIKTYPPGIRENGGQYTHGAVWAVIAFALLGDGDKAWELFTMLDPIRHADSAEAIAEWQVEPYISCADVYTAPGHLGRGGWTWYTGSAGWLYRTATEWLLGLRVSGTELHIDPCVPSHWSHYTMTLRHGSARYDITVENPHGVCRGVATVALDGETLPTTDMIPMRSDGATHHVLVVLGKA